ncbi:hypothetical protein [Bradyrhizobium sp. URHD0069]|uniref:hypothetical protein n=1 Tax=Bradyrhizobium sp. URHD0069 TaxID=1380355 RepID=UPI000495F43B|nr:hypothetical protein [Bradyrhizobium sp. URHD0069]
MSKRKKAAAIDNANSSDVVYDGSHYVHCRWCGKWVNGSDPASLAEHRGPLPHPIKPGTEWIDDDDIDRPV